MLEKKYDVTSELLERHRRPARAIARAGRQGRLASISEHLCAQENRRSACPNVDKRIFLIDDAAHLSASQAYALGASCVLQGPLNQAKLLKELADCMPAEPSPRRAEQPKPLQAPAKSHSLRCSRRWQAARRSTLPAPARPAARSPTPSRNMDCRSGSTTVRKHHEGTYQHCLLVTGLAVDFGLSLGFPKKDIERLHSAAMFHDIGKATIPLSVLDKPGRLDDSERAMIETHPGAGYDILKDNSSISPEVLDGVRHHHEYLDGSGYPDKLCAESICDLVRVLTISDIFAALIEDRRYRPPMSRADAYNILCGMNGKLEKALVAAFKDVALSR